MHLTVAVTFTLEAALRQHPQQTFASSFARVPQEWPSKTRMLASQTQPDQRWSWLGR